MKLIFKDYLDIFEKYPKDKYLTREERKEEGDRERKEKETITFLSVITKP